MEEETPKPGRICGGVTEVKESITPPSSDVPPSGPRAAGLFAEKPEFDTGLFDTDFLDAVSLATGAFVLPMDGWLTGSSIKSVSLPSLVTSNPSPSPTPKPPVLAGPRLGLSGFEIALGALF